jgi:hypothetical protein
VPFVLIDPQDPASDRYQPLWGTPSQVAARAVEPIKQSEPYYYDILRVQLDVVARVLHAADRWPPSIPFLIDAAHPDRLPQDPRRRPGAHPPTRPSSSGTANRIHRPR